MLALGVGLDHIYGSRWLIDDLFKLGFTVSYTEVTKYKQACSGVPIDQQIKSLCPEEIFSQFVADNTDHNVQTLDGKGTFHGMGIIAATIKSREDIIEEIKVKKPGKLLKADEVASLGNQIPIMQYMLPSESKFVSVILRPKIELLMPYVMPSSNADDIWTAAGLFSNKENPRPN